MLMVVTRNHDSRKASLHLFSAIIQACRHTPTVTDSGGEAAMQGHDLLNGSSLGINVSLKDTSSCSQETTGNQP